MKRILITLTLVWAVSVVFAQNNRTDDEVWTLIQEGRNEIVTKIKNDNFSGALSKLDELGMRFGDNYVILYPREEIMVELATRKFSYLANRTRIYDTNKKDDRKGFVYTDFRDELKQIMAPNQKDILNELETAEIPETDKEIIRIYMHFLFNDDIPALNKMIRRFEREHSRSSFTNFLNSLKRLTYDSRINFSVGYNIERFGEEFRSYSTEDLGLIKIELDGFIRKTYFAMHVGGGFTEQEIQYSVLNEDNEITEVEEDKVSTLKFGVKLGRIVLSSKTLKIYPYLSAGGYEVSPSSILYDDDFVAESGEVKTGIFYAGAGLSADVVLKRWKPRHMYDPEGYFFIRPNVGYNYFISPEKLFKPNNLCFSLSMGVSIGPRK